MYYRLLSYPCYHLRDLNKGFNATEMIKLRTNIKNFDSTMKEQHLDGTDPTVVFQLLVYFITEADKMRVSKVQAYLALPIYL